MTTQTSSNYYQRGVELAEAGRYQEGLNCLREHLRQAPQDVQALNDAGAILHCLGRTADAVSYLTKAWDLQANNSQVVRNLVEAYLGGGMASEVAGLLPEMERMGLLDVEVMNRTAARLLDQGKKGQAVEVLLHSRRMWPEQQVLNPMLDVIRSHRPRVALCPSGQSSMLSDLREFVEQRFRTEFHGTLDTQGIPELIARNDIVWIDGGGDLAVEVLRHVLQGTTGRNASEGRAAEVIVSLRRSDVNARSAKQIRWEDVSMLVQIGSSAVEEALLLHVPSIRHRTRLVAVPYGIDLSHSALRRRERGKHLACMGRLSMAANPAFLIQCMQKLHYIDPAYKLFFSGAFESPALEQYLRHMVRALELTDVVLFEQDCGDLNHWLSDKHFIVSAGIDENQIETVLAGMACGLKPVLHNFPGADRLFPQRHLFNIAEQFCEQVLDCDYEPQQYRRYVEERYPLEEQLRQVNEILLQLETEIERRVGTATGGGQVAAVNDARCVLPPLSRIDGKS